MMKEDESDNKSVALSMHSFVTTTDNPSTVSGNRDESSSPWVFRSKILLLIILSTAAVGCSLATGYILHHGETEKFQDEAENFANELIAVSRSKAKSLADTLKSMATTTSQYAAHMNATWPFVTIPGFEDASIDIYTRSGGSGGSVVAMLPIVYPEVVDQWNQYTVDNTHLVDLKGTVKVTENIWQYGENWTRTPAELLDEDEAFYMPVWNAVPLWIAQRVNFNNRQEVARRAHFDRVLSTGTIQTTTMYDSPLAPTTNSMILVPIRDAASPDNEIVAVLISSVIWHVLFANAIADPSKPMIVTVSTPCDTSKWDYAVLQRSFKVAGQEVEILPPEDVANEIYEGITHTFPFEVIGDLVENTDEENLSCPFTVDISPSQDFYEVSRTGAPILFAGIIFLVFLGTVGAFFLYDCLVQRRQKQLAAKAERTGNIVDALFPAQIQDRLIADEEERKNADRFPADKNIELEPSTPFLPGANMSLLQTKPIAELFASVTVMFADIVNFTAWASVREPTQVLTLLEQIYSSFDEIATSNVFKVETIGDSYLAVSGMPKRCRKHAVVMAQYADACRKKMKQIVQDLEVMLGPDTGDLRMRFGLHSGSVTGGVLRGAKGRFQLFGDTVNVASRMESSGVPDKVHVSESTAGLLQAHGKGDWIVERTPKVDIRGKGVMSSFFLDIKMEDKNSLNDNTLRGSHRQENAVDIKRHERLVKWIVDILHSQLRSIAAMRDDDELRGGVSTNNIMLKRNGACTESSTVLDEVREIISLSNLPSTYKRGQDAVDLGDRVLSQLKSYVMAIADRYHNNPFHSFDHATHVSQSVVKLMSRIVAPDTVDFDDMQYKTTQCNAQLHDHTYGITSDPLIQFSCTLSALIHDLDHPGVPNATLVKEGTFLASKYNQKSVAEQNSVDLAWNMLMQPEYSALRDCIYKDEAEFERFRQLVVNSVMATDIVDKQLGAARKARWAKAFDVNKSPEQDTTEYSAVNRKATIVIEHLIQASDVSHTMQHWHVFVKWNERLFDEMYLAYKAGRADTDPSINWYKSEIGFFDFYIIPLAKKLAECGVFGVSSTEYLEYATANRAEWERKGEEVVASYLRKYNESKKVYFLDK